MNRNYDDMLVFLDKEEQEIFVECYKEYIKQKQETPAILNPEKIRVILEHYKKLKALCTDKGDVDVKCNIPSKIDNTYSCINITFFVDGIEWSDLTWLINILEDSDSFDIARLLDGSIEIVFGFNDTGILVSEVGEK